MRYSMKISTPVALVNLTLFLLSMVEVSAGVCEMAPKQDLKELQTGFHGLYANGAWGYSVVVPDGFTGKNDSAGPQHGFGLSLGEQGNIYINGEANSLEFEAPADAAIKELESLRLDKKKIETATITQSHLGQLRASQLVVTYTCPGSAKRHILVSIYAIGPGSSPVYEVTLDTISSHYKEHRVILDRILKSWRYSGYGAGTRVSQ